MSVLDHTDLDYDPQLLGRITSDFVKIADVLLEAAHELRQRKMTDFPIFIFSEMPTKIGTPFFKPNEKGLEYWHVAASSVEEFLARQIIVHEALDTFKSVYKQAAEQACLLVINDKVNHFVFLPFPAEE